MDIFRGDRVFVIEYKNRGTESFGLLTEIEVDIVEDNRTNKIASGRTIKNGSFITNNLGAHERTSGIVVYKREHFLLKKDREEFYIGCNFSGKNYEKITKEYSGQSLFQIYVVTKLDEHVQVKFPLTDMFFESIEEVQAFIDKLNITHTQLFDDSIVFFMNKEKITINEYEVYVNGKYINEDAKERLFRYACKNKTSIGNEVYDFNKVFSLKIVNYEVSIIK